MLLSSQLGMLKWTILFLLSKFVATVLAAAQGIPCLHGKILAPFRPAATFVRSSFDYIILFPSFGDTNGMWSPSSFLSNLLWSNFELNPDLVLACRIFGHLKSTGIGWVIWLCYTGVGRLMVLLILGSHEAIFNVKKTSPTGSLRITLGRRFWGREVWV